MTPNSQGTTARPKLDDEAFEAFIMGRRKASPIWSMSGLDGYLTALIIGPKFIDPRKWIPELTGPDALNLPMETTEHRAVQTIVAEYNRIAASLSETPEDHRPRFTRIDDQTFDPFDWGYLLSAGNRIRAEALAAGPSRSCRHWRYHRAHPQAPRDKTKRDPSGCCERR
ncbi:yecA family protein [Rhizobium leguminosarum]|nr:yecA family protein [Rhizobium leguminosarum]